ncbi:MAG: WbqC family protein [bacterium]
MIVTTHQPIFLPWPGFFYKALIADCMVLLDEVQYPRGRGWMNRNRLKNEQGTLWLTAPVWKKGRGFQMISKVELCYETDWKKKHLRSMQQNYANAPFVQQYFPEIKSIYDKNYKWLIQLNVDLIECIWQAFPLKTQLILQSDLGIKGKGTDLLIKICQHLGAEKYVTFPVVEKYLDLDRMHQCGIQLIIANFHPPVYPQLWGEFIYNLSTLDLLLNCGVKSYEIIART